MMKISTNFFEVVLSKDRVFVPYLGFTDRQRLNILKKSQPKAIFMRSRDKLLFWGTNSCVPEGILKITATENPYPFLNILSHSLLEQFFQSATIKVNKRQHIYRIVFLEQDISNNKYRGVRLHRAFHLHFTPYYKNSGTALGFTVSSSVVGRISLTIKDFETQQLQYTDLRHDKESGEVFATTEAIYRLGNHFNYSSQIKQEFDLQNSIQKEYEEINSFVRNYFRNDLSNRSKIS